MAPSGPDMFLTAEDVAQLLRISKGTVYRLAQSGELPSYRVGRKLRFDSHDVMSRLGAEADAQALLAETLRISKDGTDAAFTPAAETASDQAGQEEAAGIPAGLELACEAFPLDGRRPFIIGGRGTCPNVVAGQMAERGFPVRQARCGSYTALVNLYASRMDCAVIHLYDRKTNSYNTAYAQRIAPGTPLVIVRLARIVEGFLVRPGNPGGFHNWRSLLRTGVRLANRERGCGARVLLDEKLTSLEAVPQRIEGYAREYPSAAACAAAVACGRADVGLGQARDATEAGLEFVALQEGWVDAAVLKTERTLPFVRELKAACASPQFAAELEALGMNARSCGAIVYEC